jgi:hypothetical protein
MRHAALVVRRGQDEPPMTLAGIEATLDIPAQPDDPGWYNLAADAKIEGLVHFQLNGRLETGTANILLEPLHLSARLAEPQYEVLPPRIQKVLRAYNVLGELDLTIRGAIPVRQLSESRLSADVQLHSGSLRWNELQVDVAHLAVGADVQDGKLEVVFNGEVVANPAGAPLRDSAAASSPARHGIASRRLALAGSWLDGLGPASGRLPDGLFRRCRGAGWPAGAPSSEPDERLSTQHPAPAPGALPARVSGRVSTDLRGAEPTALAAECRDLQARVVAQLLHKDLPENFDLTGRINASAQGVLRGPEWQDADVQAELQVVDAEVKVNAAAVHIPRADLAGALRQRAVSFDYKMNPFSGIVEGRGQLGFDSPGPMDLTWAIRGAELQDILSAAGRKSKSASGRLEANGALALETRRLRETVRGWAHGSIEEAELMNTPVIGGLLRILQKSLAATPLPIPGLLDNATFKCSVFPDHVVVEELEMQCQIMAARGSGRVGYDGRIDFLFNAGPIEKLESYLGQLGELLSLVSDRLVSYKVTGTLTAPQYEVRPLGLGGP